MDAQEQSRTNTALTRVAAGMSLLALRRGKAARIQAFVPFVFFVVYAFFLCALGTFAVSAFSAFLDQPFDGIEHVVGAVVVNRHRPVRAVDGEYQAGIAVDAERFGLCHFLF